MANDILIKVGADITDFSRKMKESNQALKGFADANKETFDAFKKTGTLVTGIGVALSASLGKSVKTAADFEAAMSQVQAISGATGDDFTALRDKAIEMGNATMFSASESADALSNLAQMGWETDEMLSGIEHTLNLAAAGGIELAESAMITANTMNQFGLEAAEAERIADVFALTASSAGTDVIGMGDAMQYAGANASAAGMSIEETAAFIGTLGDAGITGSKAGTSLNAMLRDLKNNAEDGGIAVGEQTIALYDSEGQMRDMPKVIGEIIKATETMTGEQRDATLATILGDQALVGFNAIASKGADSVANLAAELYDSEGAASDMAAIMQDNLNGALTQLGSAFEGVQIALGTALIPAVQKATEWLTKLADWFNGLSDGMKSTIAITLGIAAALALVAGPMLLLIGFIPQIMAGFAALKVVTLATTGVITKVTTALYAKAAATKVLGAAIRFLMGPVGWIIAGAAALTAAVIGVVKWFNRESKEAKRLAAEKDKLAEATDDLTDSVEESSVAYEDNKSDIETNAKASEDLAKKVQDLADKENKSATEKAMLAEYTKELNESVEGLNLAYDEEADALNMSAEQMQKRLDVFAGQEAVNAGMERMTEITKEQIEVEKQLEEITALREEYNQSFEDGAIKKGKYNKAIEELDEKEQALTETFSALGDEYVNVEQQVESSMDAVVESTEQAVDEQKIAYDELSDTLKQSVDDMKSAWQDLANASTSVFDKISSDAEVSFAEMQETFDHNVKATEEWATNLQKLAEAGVSNAFLDTFREKGPQSAALVQELVDADIAEVIKLGEGFEKQTEKALDQMAQAYNLDTKQFEAVRHLVEDVGMTFSEAIESADFSQHGMDIAEGAETGIYDGTGGAVSAVTDMADDMQDGFKSANDIHSPSRVYQDFGVDIVDGLVAGVDNSSNKAVTVLNKLVKDMLVQFKNIGANFNKIGRDAMSGFRAGLNAGRGSVMGVARGIANSVASTMRSALKIKSPSRVLMEIGRYSGEGLTDGLLATQRMVEVASERLAVAAVPDIDMSYATPTGIQSSLSSAINGTVDVNSREDLIAGAIANLERRLDGMQVVMEGETVGRIVAPTVSETINEGKNNAIRNGGRRRL